MARIPFLIGAIYSIGYQQGTVDTIRNPLKLQQGMFETVMLQMGVDDGREIDILTESEFFGRQRQMQNQPIKIIQRVGWTLGQTMADVGWTKRRQNPQRNNSNSSNNAATNHTADAVLTVSSTQHKDDAITVSNNDDHKYRQLTIRVATVGHEILRAARKLVQQEMEKAVAQAIQNITVEQFAQMTEAERIKALHADEDVDMWVKAQQRLEGEKLNGIHNWQYVLVGSPIPNAFVSEMLPQRFFVTRGLFENFVDNDDELAMILGHELSHLLLGHMSERNLVDFMLRGLEVFLLAMDPTEGLLSLGITTFLANAREALTAAHSRHHETEADAFGCRLAAMACYDTKRGTMAFHKMHEFDVTTSDKRVHSIMATHPPSDERYHALVEIAEGENMYKYSYCTSIGARLRRALTRRE